MELLSSLVALRLDSTETTKVAIVTLQDEQRWRGICRHAMRENNIDELLKIYLALDRDAEREQRKAVQGKKSIGLGKTFKNPIRKIVP